MIQFPKNKIWTQLNGPDNQGDLWSSFNLDTSEREGRLRIGKRLVVNTNSTDNVNLNGYPTAFTVFQGSGTKKIYTIAGNNLFGTSTLFPSGSFSLITSINLNAIDSTVSDMALFPGNSTGGIWIAQKSEKVAYSSDGSSWNTLTVGSAESTSSHSLCYYNGTARMYMSKNNSEIYSWDRSNSISSQNGSYYLQLGTSDENVITFIRSASDRLWIGIVDTLGGKGHVYEWDGITANTPQKVHRLEASGALACVVKDDIPYIVDSNGALLYWNGGTFGKLAQLNRKNNKLLYNPLSTINNRFIHPNGMTVVQGKIHILINGQNYTSTGEVEETIPSGIWEFDTANPGKGLIHKYSFGLSHAGDSITDYGAIRISGAGAITEINLPNNSSSRNGTFLAGATYYTDATTTTSAIFYDDTNDTLQKAGSFVLTKIDADDGSPYHLPAVQNMWDSLYTMYKNFTNSNDKIVLKYRTSESEPLQNVSITWASTTTFTTTTDLTSYWTSGTGGEIEVLNGVGAGKCAHITNIVNNSGTYTVTVDETFTGATGTALIRVQNWKKIGAITKNNQTFNADNFSVPSNWMQIKGWVLFTGKDEIERIIVTNLNTQPAK